MTAAWVLREGTEYQWGGGWNWMISEENRIWYSVTRRINANDQWGWDLVSDSTGWMAGSHPERGWDTANAAKAAAEKYERARR